jgi:biopolymer transport protein ExbD
MFRQPTYKVRMNNFNFLQKKHRRTAAIDISPLMDMVFILLIFFVVTSTFTRETGVEITKPQAQSASQLEKENILIAITREGTIHVNERQVDLAGLRDVLADILAKNSDREAVLISDKASMTGTLVQVIDACNIAGVKKVSVAALSP